MHAEEKITLLFLFAINICSAQQINEGDIFSPPGNPCGAADNLHLASRRPVPYNYIREADMAFEKRMWRDIDLREKQNLPLYYPLEFLPCRSSLFQTLAHHILKGNITAFADENFAVPLEKIQVRKRLVQEDSMVQIFYKENGEPVEQMVFTVDSVSIYKRILKYRLKEDWFFDRQRSELQVRIIGLAAYEWVEDKEVFRELFWVYFPQCRNFLARTEAFNTRNDSEQRSFEEVFRKRMFSSAIVKESNVYDRYINEYSKGIDALLESDQIKMDLFNMEQDMWHY